MKYQLTSNIQDDNRDCLIGVISDTHGLMRPEAIRALHGVSLIVHAGDVGAPEVLEALQNIAPVVAVRGNTDQDYWARKLLETEVAEIGDLSLYVLHNIHELDLDPAASGFSAVIYGHSHMPSIESKNGVLYLNPGSAGPRRFKLPVTVALLKVKGRELTPQIVNL
ncbi:MAG: metallophosphoesterase family protein [Nitrospirota bacterium]